MRTLTSFMKNWCLWTVVLEKTLENPLDCKEIKPVHPKGNQPEYSLEGLMLKLKLHYFGHLMWRTDSFEKILMLGKIEGRRRRGWQRMKWLDGITTLMDLNLSKLWELLMDRGTWTDGHSAVHEVAKSQSWLSNWTELNNTLKPRNFISTYNMSKLLFQFTSPSEILKNIWFSASLPTPRVVGEDNSGFLVWFIFFSEKDI